MTKLKLATIEDQKPVKITIELPPGVHRDLVAYGELLSGADKTPIEPARLIAPMIARFMDSDQAFKKLRNLSLVPKADEPDSAGA